MKENVLFIIAAALLLPIPPVLLLRALLRSVRKTLYSYRNIVLTGGLLFTLAFSGALTVFFLSDGLSERTLNVSALFEFTVFFPRSFALFALPVILLIAFLIFLSNIALIRHEGFRPKNLLGILLGGGDILVTGGMLYLTDFLFDRISRTAEGLTRPILHFFGSTLPVFLLILLCYFDCIFLACFLLGYAAVKKKPAYDKDLIIILGCSIDKAGGLRPLLRERVNSAVRFAWDQERATGRPVMFLPSGGKGENEPISEGSAMELYLLTHGAEPSEILTEKESRTTRENMLFSKKIIDSLGRDVKVAFSTTNYHVLRSGILARMAGIPAEGVAAPTRWYFWPNGFLREVVAIIVMYRKAHIRAAALIGAVCFTVGLLSLLL